MVCSRRFGIEIKAVVIFLIIFGAPMNILVNIEVKSSLVSRIDESDATLLQRSYIAGKKGPCVKIDPKV